MPVTRFCFKLADGANYIDLAQCMSLVQRTLVRQKQTFTVLGGQVVDNSNGKITISTAPNFWYTKAAINRGFRAWKQVRAKTIANAELENVENPVGKYSDFKVTLNGVTSTLLPIAGSTFASLPAPEEWNYSDVINEDGLSRTFKIVGTNAGVMYGLMEGWIKTRETPDASNEPTMPDLDGDGVLDYRQDFLNLLHETSDGQPERLANIYEDNDKAPFKINELYSDTSSNNNLQIQSYTRLQGAAGMTSAMIPGFEALCGLIQVSCSEGSSEPILFLDVMNTPEAF